MKKYWHVINIGIQNTLVYRVNFLFRASFALIPLIATISLWRAVFASKTSDPSVVGYSLAGMISYYLLVTIVDAFTAVNEDDWQIAADIKDGKRVEEGFSYTSDNNKEWMSIEQLNVWIETNREKIGRI